MISLSAENRHIIAFNIDLLIPGFYTWTPWFSVCLGGETPDDKPYRYSGRLYTRWGIVIVFPGYKIAITNSKFLRPRNYALDGVDGSSIQEVRSESASLFERLMNSAGYKESGISTTKGKRLKVLWIHPKYRRIESIFSEDRSLFLTAYHPV